MADPLFQSLALSFSALAKGIQSLNKVVTGGDARKLVTELYDIIGASQARAFEAQIAHTATVDRIRELEKKLADVESWKEEKKRYKLAQPWEGAGFVVYALRESAKNGDPPHWACTKCCDDGRRSILYPKQDALNMQLLACPTCMTEISTGFIGAPLPQYAPG